ncbi:acetyl-CoA acetyltransferase [Altererythrobacter aurantiacus]|uniref:Acetyl-CoA acetyltransferase n=1 Tax=Parapontixanthobacter aurantiacus TaxID=1463599 RepID=A0A844ZD70_9SPHN|nr:acetyl-CoA acetyltransferase [Parapontixanthobacter aurantiacus]MXO85815.1 acetyl-CoA acetyltransferase [Parapontixanthobacter aurantiacus]
MSLPQPERIPVLVGVGQINDRPARNAEGLNARELMIAALQEAERDAGGGWLAQCDRLALVTQWSFRQLNPVAKEVAEAIGARPATLYESGMPKGDSPMRLLNEAANAIGAGEARIAAIAGGEALRTAAALAREGKGPSNPFAKSEDGGEQPLNSDSPRPERPFAHRYGLVMPADVYPLYENAGRAAYGQTLAEGQAESGTLWSKMSQVAADNEQAWLRESLTHEEIIRPSASNRRMAFPYTKFLVANAAVNQGAAMIVTSLAEARRRNIPEKRIIHIGLGAAAHEADDYLKRDSYAASAGMKVTLERVPALNGLAAKDLDHVELYSCFPCVPKMARRVLGFDEERPITVFGGLTFGGAPIGNYMSHAAASMTDLLRREGGTGLLFANGGYATHNHAIVLSAEPLLAASFPQNFDFQAEADALRGEIPELNEDYAGPAVIETYTVLYDRSGAVEHGIIVARTNDGRRTLAIVPANDETMIAFLTEGNHEPVGTGGTIIAGGADGLQRWVMA